MKQTMITTSSNHAGLSSLQEASRYYVWLRSLIQHIQQSYGLFFRKINATTIKNEDNIACIAKLKNDYIKDLFTK